MPGDEQDKAGVVAPPPLIYLAALVFWPAPQQKVSDYLSAAHHSATPRVAASWWRSAARGLVRMGDVTCRYTG
jgi:hypothetical protein